MTTLTISQVEAEVITKASTPKLQVSQVEAEAITKASAPKLQVSQIVIEVLCQNLPITGYRLTPSIT